LKLRVATPVVVASLLVAAALPLACKRGRAAPDVRGPAPAARRAKTAPAPVPAARRRPASKVRHEVVFGTSCRIQRARPCAFAGLPDRSYRSVFLRHEDLPKGRLTLTFPEGVRFRPLCGLEGDVAWAGGPKLREPAWIVGKDHLSYVQRWRPGPGHGGLDLEASWRLSCAGPDSLSVEMTVKNRGSEVAPYIEPVVCLAADENSCSGLSTFYKDDRISARRFHTRTGWVKFDFTAQIAVEGVSYEGKRGCYKEGTQSTSGLVITESIGSRWLMGLGWDRARTLSIGAQDCIHSHPLVYSLKPGESVTRKGRVYLTRATKEALLQRYRKELGKE